ncbi:hypothetical protein AN216_23235 [Streptomyces oceani]|uniref:Uncharacterized protein n=1 Tax=Streptomyces oceani TaxID=1075402 RepID=A0A1E7JWG3_9ACTN|nr:hypothetical protein AN216_23235 [Streptomyces oceani]
MRRGLRDRAHAHVGRGLVSHMGGGHAWVGSVNISIDKTFTARVFDSPTRGFYGVRGSNQGRMMIFANGIPPGAAASRIRRSSRRP